MALPHEFGHFQSSSRATGGKTRNGRFRRRRYVALAIFVAGFGRLKSATGQRMALPH